MKVSELIEFLKGLPQDLKVYGPSEDNSECDYWPISPEQIIITRSELVDEESDENPKIEDICVIGDWYI